MSIKECLQDRRLQCLGCLERMEENVWFSKCRSSNVGGSSPRGKPIKTWNDAVRNDLRENNSAQ